MIYKFSVAQINIKFIADFDIQIPDRILGFSNDFVCADVNIFLSLGDVESYGEIIYSEDWFDVYKVSKDEYRIIYRELFTYKKLICRNNPDHLSFEKKDDNYYGVMNKGCNEESKSFNYIWNQIDFSHIMLERNRVILHASYIIHNDKAIIFCGRSGVGKSTQADLWKKYCDADIINGDKCIVYESDGKLLASSLPICGTSGICKNKIAEIGAILFLEQSEENEIIEIRPTEKVGNLIKNSVYDVWRKGDLLKIIDLCTLFYDKTKCILYKCRADKSAAELLKEVIG